MDIDKNDPNSPHRRAWDSIPWFVAGSASEADTALLMQHLPACSTCRDELQFQQQVQASMRAATPAVPDPEAALQRLLARMDAAEDAGPPARSMGATRRGESPWTRWLIAAVLVQAVGLGAAMLALLGPGRGDGFRTLSEPVAASRVPMLLLVPAPTMDFAALRLLLRQTHLAVVDTAPDASSLHLGAQDDRWATAEAALPQLRSLPGVLLAEPTGHER